MARTITRDQFALLIDLASRTFIMITVEDAKVLFLVRSVLCLFFCFHRMTRISRMLKHR